METRYGLAIETLSSNLSGGTSQYSSMDRVSSYEGLDAGSTPTTGSICHDSLAVKPLLHTEKTTGSNPVRGTTSRV